MLLPRACELGEMDAEMPARLDAKVFADIVAQIPESWLTADPSFGTDDERRAAYADYLTARMRSPRAFVEEAIRARTRHL